jgi:glycosyltransferase involved in cell wall biosynthesis
MISRIKTILICQIPLPYDKIGSWTNMYNYLLRETKHDFDFIVCPEGSQKAEMVSYKFVEKPTILDKIKSKFLDNYNRFNNYFAALDSIIEKDSKYIIHIIDNSGIVVPIDTFLKKRYNRSDFFIQYYYQGFAPLFSKEKANPFLYAVDEIFFLTELSYLEYLNFYDECPFRARVLHNATNSNQFKLIESEEKRRIRESLGFTKDEFIFIWCSQDRVKKGLHIVLDAFKGIYSIHKEKVKLVIVGIDRAIEQEGVQVIGRVPNHELAKYYQISDVYLFPSLWKEGFGIVLAEALKCGCYVIASAQGGIPEVLNQGKFGKLISNPNMVSEWVNSMNESIQEINRNDGNPYMNNLPDQLYDVEDWALKVKEYISEAKNRI